MTRSLRAGRLSGSVLLLHSVFIIVVVVTIIIFLFFSAGDGAQGLVYAKQVNTTRLHFQSKAILFFVFLYDVFWEGALGAQTGLELEIFLSLSLQSAGIELLSTAHHCAWFQFCVLLF